MTATALFAGDASWDLTLRVARLPQPDEKLHVDEAVEGPGGVVANAAVACALAGAPARALLRIGNDDAGRRLGEALARRGVSVSATAADGPTCRVVILLESHGEKRLLLHPGVSMHPSPEQAADASLDGVRWLHTAVYDRDATAILVDRCRQRAIPWSIDLEPATFAGGIDSLAPLLDGAAVVFCNSRAAARIGDDAASALRALGVRSVLLTRGADGARWLRGDGTLSATAPAASVVDTTGAGDCLAGWLVGELLLGQPPQQALERAATAATLSCGRVGAQESFPTRAEVDVALGTPLPRRAGAGR